MIQFLCDTCSRTKKPNEIWILGLAAEAVGITAARREVTILSGWDWDNSVHPLAIHFCSEACKQSYVDRLFGGEVSQPPQTEVIRAETTAIARRAAKPRTHKKKSRKRAA
jgi:hypothetical protein